MGDDDRITRLETALAHHERQIQDLSDIINYQRQEIDLLSRRLTKTQGKLIELQEGGAQENGDKSLTVTEQAARDKPPHY